MATPDFWDDFVRVAKLSRSAVDEIMKQYGGRGGQNHILWALYEKDGLTPIEVARKLGIAAPTVVKMSSHMVASGLITRRRDSVDRRRVHLYLTDRGRAVKRPIEEATRQFRRATSAGLTAEERKVMSSALAKIVRNLERSSRSAALDGSGD
ncbi:MAG TPA: MarR family transcriptional regulator [Thermoplasmata archaeon]|nr:MarR family transcriptional regulator [Thermoplasmata archaeon]